MDVNCKAWTGAPERKYRESKLLYQCAGRDGVVERRKVGVLADSGHQAQQKLKSSPVGRRQQEAADLKSLSGHVLLLEQAYGDGGENDSRGEQSQIRGETRGESLLEPHPAALTQDVDEDFI